MGGVHSCMVASLYPEPVACSPMLTPRSAAVAFCQGALQQAWEPLSLTSAAITPTVNIPKDLCLSGRTLPPQTSPPSTDQSMIRLDSLLGDRLALGTLGHEAPEQPFYPEDFESEAGVLWRWYLLESKAQAQKQLQQVLERYTDVKKFPRPKRPDAAVFVAARDDAYVSPDSVLEVHRYWEGSEMRWVPGGHVSSFLFQTEAFCGAIKDSVRRVAQGAKQLKVGSQMSSTFRRLTEAQPA
ncbi:unnamed protein product [Ostreobium quekettii]|uniref:Uncharacterized protein n=1 Tax=Ostreobium quekettii TaxID=121088 RepID=A0A8S1J0H6_9CHLO|nr:unnamed protein product [Ostreobium quekettii]|eukprot:evm.model.scf_60.9 EVM.evm.TU.scf_60.9   scf_60:91609-93192(+)